MDIRSEGFDSTFDVLNDGLEVVVQPGVVIETVGLLVLVWDLGLLVRDHGGFDGLGGQRSEQFGEKDGFKLGNLGENLDTVFEDLADLRDDFFRRSRIGGNKGTRLQDEIKLEQWIRVLVLRELLGNCLFAFDSLRKVTIYDVEITVIRQICFGSRNDLEHVLNLGGSMDDSLLWHVAQNEFFELLDTALAKRENGVLHHEVDQK